MRTLLEKTPTMDTTTKALLRLLPQLSPPLCARVQEYVSSRSVSSSLPPPPPPPPPKQDPGPLSLYTMSGVARAHCVWIVARQAVAADAPTACG